MSETREKRLHPGAPYSFRNKVICILLLFSLLAALISFVCSYLVSRTNVRSELSAAQTEAAINLLELRQKTTLPVSTLLQMAATDSLNVSLVEDAHDVRLTAEQLAILEERQIITVTRSFSSMPVTFVLLDDSLVRISPSAHVNVFLSAVLRFIFAGLIFTLLFIFFGTVSAHVIARPVAKLTKASRRLADGDFSVRLPEDQPGEMGELMRSFNHMAEALGRTAYLQKDFISSISHEFKTPIASIKGFARLLQMPGLDEAARAEYVNMIASESDRLSNMSRTLLRLASLEEQMTPASVSPFRLDEQLREVILQLAPAWENRQIDWHLELNPVTIASDEELLRQVWVNLLQNAVKFSDVGSAIQINVYEAGDAVVEITDHGIGMDEATVARIFDRFYQADASRSREGVGLGLCLVKRIVDILGGAIRVRSTPGEGSTFRVRLPLKINPIREELQHHGQQSAV